MNHQEKQDKESGFSFTEDFPLPTWQEWYDDVVKGLKGVPFEKALLTPTAEGITLKPLYTREDVKDNPFLENLPGFAPYVRNTAISGSAKGSWAIEQAIDIPEIEEWNKTLLNDLNRGQNAVYIKLDENARNAKSLKDLSPEDMGKDGLPVYSLNDLRKALKDIYLPGVRVDIEAYSSALACAAMLETISEEKNIELNQVKGSVAMDPVAVLAQNGTLNHSWKQAMDEMAELTRWANQKAPQMKTILIDATVWNNSGASAVQELAYALSTAVLYMNELLDRGLSIDQIAPRITFSFGVGKHLFMEIAKLRAARLLWSQIIENYNGSAESQKMYIFSKTSLYNKTYYDPWVNILRTSTEAFSAVLGSCDALCVTPFDAVVKPSDDFSRRIARNQQSILLEESHLNSVIDPAGGSWYVETLTQEIAQKAWESFQAIETEGLLNALKNESIQKQIEQTHNWKVKQILIRKEALIGTSVFANVAEKTLDPVAYDYQAIYQKASAELSGKSSAVTMNENIIDQMKKELAEGIAVSDIYATLRANETADLQIKKIEKRRLAESFETLRNASMAYMAKNGHLPKVFMADMAPIAAIKPRMDFSAGFFQPGGFDVFSSDYYESMDKAIEDIIASKAPVAVICSTDDSYPELVPAMAAKLKTAKPELIVVLAGYPVDHLETFKQSGVDFFIHLKADLVQTLSDIMKKTGVL